MVTPQTPQHVGAACAGMDRHRKGQQGAVPAQRMTSPNEVFRSFRPARLATVLLLRPGADPTHRAVTAMPDHAGWGGSTTLHVPASMSTSAETLLGRAGGDKPHVSATASHSATPALLNYRRRHRRRLQRAAPVPTPSRH